MLGGVWLIYFGFGLLSLAMAPLVDPISRDLGLSYTTMGAILGAWPLVYIVAAAPCGAFVDRVGLKWSLFLAALIITASGGLRVVAVDAVTMFVAVGLFGIGGPLVSTAHPWAPFWAPGRWSISWPVPSLSSLRVLASSAGASFARREARFWMASGIARKTGWMLSEHAGFERPWRIQGLLWDADALRDEVRAYVVEALGCEDGVLVVDETGFLKKGRHSVGVARQYTGTAAASRTARSVSFSPPAVSARP